jgi:predicted RNase H-like nuclease (RuvC/YqgF family)
MMSRADMQVVADMQKKLHKQRQEIARLTREIEQLTADKANLRFDLHKIRAAAQQKGITI